MSEVVLSVRNVSKVFGVPPNQHHALREVSLDVMPGEVLMLCGPSGSGKTTLLSIMGGILTPTSGDVLIAGHSMAGLDRTALAALRRAYLGFIFQEYNLFPALDCLGNVMVALDIQGADSQTARAVAEEKLRDVGLGDRLTENPARLSGGQKQRLAIARALAGSPPVLLADEPTAALDSGNGAHIMRLLRELAQSRQCAVVIVTHDPRIRDAADRIVTIEDGRIYNGDGPERALAHTLQK